jgi:hypothetical protein
MKKREGKEVAGVKVMKMEVEMDMALYWAQRLVESYLSQGILTESTALIKYVPS